MRGVVVLNISKSSVISRRQSSMMLPPSYLKSLKKTREAKKKPTQKEAKRGEGERHQGATMTLSGSRCSRYNMLWMIKRHHLDSILLVTYLQADADSCGTNHDIENERETRCICK